MKKFVYLSLSAMMVIALAAFQQPTPAKKAVSKAPKVATSDKAYDIKFDKTFHDFGKATEGEQVETTFILTNIGKEPIIISKHEVQCGCTTPTYSKEPIMPGKSANIKVGFNTHGKMGINDKTVTIHTNGGVHELKFRCEVTAKPNVDPIEPGAATIKMKTN